MKLFYCLSIMLLLGGCTEDARIKVLEQKLEAANTEIAKLQVELNQLKATTQEVKEEIDKMDMTLFISDLDKYAYLTPGTDGYTVIRYDLGAITAKIVDIKPYANGSMVTLEFGNPLSTSIGGLKATLDWGKVDGKGSPINDQAKSREITFNEELKAGYWTKVSLVLDGVPASELGFIRLKNISHKSIGLFR